MVPVLQATGQPAESRTVVSRTGLGAASNWHMLESAKRIIIKLYDAAVTPDSNDKKTCFNPPAPPCGCHRHTAMLHGATGLQSRTGATGQLQHQRCSSPARNR